MRNSIDDSGMAMHSSVHFGVDFDNAIWTGNQMVYGDGSDLFLKKGSVASNLTVTAHELTHGVTDFEADLGYRNEPNKRLQSLNDSFIYGINKLDVNKEISLLNSLLSSFPV